MSHVLCVLTAPRQVSYLAGTLCSLEKAGLRDWKGPKILLVDGQVDLQSVDTQQWQVLQDGLQRGPLHRFREAVLRAIEAGTPLTFFQDDLLFAKNALNYIQAEWERNLGSAYYISWFTILMPPSVKQSAPLWDPKPVRSFGNMVACTFSLSTLKALAEHPDFSRTNLDSHKGNLLPAQGSMLVHYPNLVEHVGDVCAVRPLPPRRAFAFAGEEFDCAVWKDLHR